ncbi:MAG: hypothetical protein FWG14_13155 [Peptococcaceae bacterium]|nr:hypothetical protein [Peptococcaceae bacterium]
MRAKPALEKRKVGEGGNPEETAKFYWDGNRLLAEDRDGQVYLYEPGSFVPLALVRSEAVDITPKRKAGALPALQFISVL